MSASIRYIERKQIDDLKWNEAISRSANGLIYAYSYYLDTMASHWDALIMGDYEYLMPLPWRKKFGIKYLYQPAFTASLGIFGENPGEEITNKFIENIPSTFKLIEIDLNRANKISNLAKSSFERTNYVLPLSEPYPVLQSKYRDNIKRNIRKAVQLNCTYRKEIAVETIVDVAKNQLPVTSNTSDSDFTNFIQLFNRLKQENKAITRGVYSASNELLASCVFFFSHGRAYYILVGNNPNGKTLGASHFLIDRFMEEHAGSNLILDFEGSDIRNLAFFYSSFGATPEQYPALRINRLPFLIRLLKR